MRGRQNAAVGAVDQRFMILRILAGEHGEALRAAAQQFERLVADYCGTAEAVAVTSCTTALHLALPPATDVASYRAARFASDAGFQTPVSMPLRIP